MTIEVLADSAHSPGYATLPDVPEYSLAVNMICAMPSLEEVVAYAIGRLGFETNDGYYGIAYPPLGRPADGTGLADIPSEMVQVWEFWGIADADKRLLFERDYLEILSNILRINKWIAEADEIEQVRLAIDSNTAIFR